MKRTMILTVLVGLAAFFGIVFYMILPGTGPASSNPRVDFHYNRFIDNYLCPPGAKQIRPTWHQELETRMPELQAKWQKESPSLLSRTIQLIGKKFPHSNYDVSIFLCSALSGLGIPLIVPVNLYLNAPYPDPQEFSRKWSDGEFVDAVFHELLHIYVADALHWNLWSPLLKKYASEDLYTKIHLHLYAIQKQVYLETEHLTTWHQTIHRAKEFPREYSRAIDIVESDGTLPFLEELRK